MKELKKVKGFSILSILLFIAGIIVAFGIWVLSGNSNTTQDDKNTEVLATTIINDGLKYKATLEQHTIGKPKLFAENLTFYPNVSNELNLLDPANGVGWERVNSKALIAGSSFPKGYWAYNKSVFHAPATGTVTNDPTFLVSGLTDPVCKKINFILNGTNTIPVLPLTGSQSTTDIRMTNADSYVNLQMHSSLPLKWSNGCINKGNNPNDNFYFQVGQIN